MKARVHQNISCECGFYMAVHNATNMESVSLITCANQLCPHHDKLFRYELPTIEVEEVPLRTATN